ncbi:MAG: heavy metal-binding domain-containing protein [Pseudomonadales bacterium]|nr:heavy metal-binding domain-containing protein [Pseudomonadales bacterium]
MDLIIFLGLICIGYVAGSVIERRHFRSIEQREAELADIYTYSARLPPTEMFGHDAFFVTGNVVVSVDYFKTIAASRRALIGGVVVVFESLLNRARREAVLRMKAEARKHGATTIFNIKMETSSIYKGGGNQIGSVEVYTYGTALRAPRS